LSKKPTLKDVADKTGVSVPTVSMVIHGKGRITNETRERVLQCALDMGYPIHQRKIAKKASPSNVVAILFNIDPEWSFIWDFIRPVIHEIENSMRDASYTTIIIPITNQMSIDKILAKITDSGANAVFAMHFGNTPLFINLEQNAIPVVLVMNNDLQDKFHSICADDFQGAYEGTRYLIEKGHTKIAYIDTVRPNLPRLLHDRFYGFRKALAENNIPFPKNFSLRYCIDQEAEFLSKLSALLHCEDPPTAFFCLDDELAARVIKLLTSLNKKIPEDFSILAPGDVLDYDSPLVPKITTMQINTVQMGIAAADMMLLILKGEKNNQLVVKIRQELVDRDSCSILGDNRGGHRSKSS